MYLRHREYLLTFQRVCLELESRISLRRRRRPPGPTWTAGRCSPRRGRRRAVQAAQAEPAVLAGKCCRLFNRPGKIRNCWYVLKLIFFTDSLLLSPSFSSEDFPLLSFPLPFPSPSLLKPFPFPSLPKSSPPLPFPS